MPTEQTSQASKGANPPLTDDAPRNLVDVHMHFLPEVYRTQLAAAGLKTLDGGMPVPAWSETLALETMDRLGVEVAILSVSSPSVRFLEGDAQENLCRQINKEGGDLMSRHPDRFGLFATLPLPDTDAALSEIAYAFDELGAVGIIIETNIHGMYLGDERLAPVFDELNRRKAVVFIHPTSPACFESLGLGRPAPMIEFPMDTTRTVVDLIYSGTIKRCPDMKVILPHGGGTLPTLAQRIAAFAGLPFVSPKPDNAKEVMSQLASFYYDVVMAAHPASFTALRTIAPIEQLLYGTDWPFSSIDVANRNVAQLRQSDLTQPELDLIYNLNAQKLFPRLKSCCGG